MADHDMQTLISGLNEDLANEYSAMIMYNYNAATVSGLYSQILKEFFAGEVMDEIGHAQYLSEKIAALGGIPLVKPAEVKQAKGVQEMLEVALQAEKETIQRYVERIGQAKEVNEYALITKLEDMIADETEHKEELERLLKDPRLS